MAVDRRPGCFDQGAFERFKPTTAWNPSQEILVMIHTKETVPFPQDRFGQRLIPSQPRPLYTPSRRDRSVCSRWSGSQRCFCARNAATAASPCTRANDDDCSTASFA